MKSKDVALYALAVFFLAGAYAFISFGIANDSVKQDTAQFFAHANTNLDAITTTATSSVVSVSTAAGNVLDSAQRTIDKSGVTFDRINKPCKGSGDVLFDCGTIADIDKTLNATRYTATLFNVAAAHEDKQLGTFDAILQHTDSILGHTDMTVQHADSFISDPNMARIVENLQGITYNSDHMLGTFDEVTTKATHDYLHPSPNPFVRGWKDVKPFLIPAAQIGGAIAISK